MTRTLLTLVLILFAFPGLAEKLDFEIPYGSSFLCEEEKKVGFSGSKNKEMFLKNFKTLKYIIKKIDKETIKATEFDSKITHEWFLYNTCKKNKSSKDLEGITDTHAMLLNRCNTYSKLGEQPQVALCMETYDEKNLYSIHCENDREVFSFQPYGFFRRFSGLPLPLEAYIEQEIEGTEEYLISYGKCSEF